MAVVNVGRSRMLNAAVKNTHIVSQNVIRPTIHDTLRLMPTCRIESSKPLRSAAVCRPSESLRAEATRSKTRAAI